MSVRQVYKKLTELAARKEQENDVTLRSLDDNYVLPLLKVNPIAAFTPEYFRLYSSPLVPLVPVRSHQKVHLVQGTFSPMLSACLRGGTLLGGKSAPVLIGWANCKPRPVKL